MARFDIRFDSEVIGCRKGFFLDGDFRENGRFPSFIIVFGVAGSKLQTGKMAHRQFSLSACSVTQMRLPLQLLAPWPVHSAGQCSMDRKLP